MIHWVSFCYFWIFGPASNVLEQPHISESVIAQWSGFTENVTLQGCHMREGGVRDTDCQPMLDSRVLISGDIPKEDLDPKSLL